MTALKISVVSANTIFKKLILFKTCSTHIKFDADLDSNKILMDGILILCKHFVPIT